MKLATLKNNTRNGELVVVRRDLKKYISASSIVVTMREALDHWEVHAPQLQALSDELNNGDVAGKDFDPHQAMAPLPNPSQWADGSAYVNHVELVRKARGAELPDSFWEDPLMYMGAPDATLGAHDDVEVGSEE